MSQHGGNYYQEQQPHPGQSPYPQTQGQYPSEHTQYAPPPYAEQAYPHGGQHTQTQYCQTSEYDPAAKMPHDHAQSQYQQQGANASYYNGEPYPGQNDNAPDGEKGLGSTVVGGAAGGYMGHKMGGGWGTAAGAALGAVGMNMVSHRM